VLGGVGGHEAALNYPGPLHCLTAVPSWVLPVLDNCLLLQHNWPLAHSQVVAILGGQPSVLSNSTLVEHALRMTLVADSLSLQFRLPPPGLSTPVARTSPVIAGGVPVVDAMVLTSVWAVQVLRSLSQVGGCRVGWEKGWNRGNR
jgi:hypothetical protein